MNRHIEAIKQYILEPGQEGQHLRAVAEGMARNHGGNLYKAAEVLAGFIYLGWDGEGSEEYAPRTYEIMRKFQDGAMKAGMDGDASWMKAIEVFGDEVSYRSAVAPSMAVGDAELETLRKSIIDGDKEFGYLHDVAECVKELHWYNKHSPRAVMELGRLEREERVISERGNTAIEMHLEKVSTLGVMAYVEGANITRGAILKPTDPAIIHSDLTDIQISLDPSVLSLPMERRGQHWTRMAAQSKVASYIEGRFGREDGRNRAGVALRFWKRIAKGENLRRDRDKKAIDGGV